MFRSAFNEGLRFGGASFARPTNWIAASVIVVVAACSSGPATPDAQHYPGAPNCILGTGVIGFIAMSDNYPARIVHGGQGGYHIWGSVLVRYMNFKQLQLQYTYRDAVTNELYNTVDVTRDLSPADPSLVYYPPAPDLVPDPLDGGGHDGGNLPNPDEPGDASVLPTDFTDWGIWLGSTVFIPYELDGGADMGGLSYFVGRHVQMSLTVTDTEGRTCSDHHVVIPVGL